MMKASAVATRVVSLMTELSVSASLSDQVNWVHAHHTSQKTMTPRSTPVPVRSWASIAVICVTAKTKTRSKNSST